MLSQQQRLLSTESDEMYSELGSKEKAFTCRTEKNTPADIKTENLSNVSQKC
jgi:hypothetical protein